MVSFFGSKKKSLLQDAVRGAWRNDDEKSQIIESLGEESLSAIDSIQLIWSRDAGIRSVGVRKFLDAVDDKALRQLIREMEGKPSHQRGFVNRIFARVDGAMMKTVVDELLIHKDPGQRRLAWAVALELREDLRQGYLVKAVREAPAALRVTALQRLLQGGDPREHLDLLVDLASDPTNAKLSTTALEACAEIDDERVAKLMVRVFTGPDARAREVAVKYLRAAADKNPELMRGKMLSLLGGGEDATRQLCVEILLKTGPHKEVIVAILEFSRELVGWLRNRILETLQTFGDEVLRPALELLDHPDEEIRTGALVLCEGFQDPRLIPPLTRMLKDPDWWLRIIACEALGRLKDERAVDPLVAALQDDDARWAAIDALATIGSPKALKPLAGLLRADRVEVRREVVRAFGNFADARLLKLLSQVADKDPASEIRTLAQEVHRDMAARLDVSQRAFGQTASVSSATLSSPIDKLLAKIREMGASDLHLACNEPPFVRSNGRLERMEGMKALSPKQVNKAIRATLDDRQEAWLDRWGQVDYCYAIPEVGRYRANAYLERHGMSAAFRVIPNTPPTFADLRLPGHLTELLDYHQGIILVSGPAGSGKSTTLSAIVNLINQAKPVHVLMLEDPIEFVHPAKTALVNQREVNGKHSASFKRALRGALREDPDIIVVGQLTDPETTHMALEAAETGHLVIATMNTTSAVQTIERLVGSFSPEEQPAVRMALSEAMKYVVSQSLVERKDGKGRVAVFEILKNVASMESLIRDGKTPQMPGMMEIGQRFGMQTVDQALMELYEADLISAETAWLRAEKPETFEPYCDPDFLAGVEREDENEGEGETKE